MAGYATRIDQMQGRQCQGRLTFGSFGCLVSAPFSYRTILQAHAAVTNRALRAHTSGASTSSND
jgi:hypothetical protein